MKSYLLLPILSFLTFTVCAQAPTFKWGPEQPLERHVEVIKVLGIVNDSWYTVEKNPQSLSLHEYNLCKYNKELSFSSRSKVVTNMGRNDVFDNLRYTDMFLMKNKIRFFGHGTEKKSKTETLIYQEFSHDGTPLTGYTILDTISNADAQVWQSEDSSRILTINYQNEMIKLQVYDKDMKRLNRYKVDLLYGSKDYYILEAKLTKEGMVYLLVKVYNEQTGKSKNIVSNDYDLLSIDPQGKLSRNTVNADHENVFHMKMELFPGSIVCAGLFNNETKTKDDPELSGLLLLKTDRQTGNIIRSKKELPKDFVATVIPAKNAEKGQGITGSYEVKQILAKSNGEYCILTEDAAVYRQSVGETNREELSYVMNNIIAVQLSKDLNAKSYSVIHKKQQTKNDYGDFNSFLALEANDKIMVIYNDVPENLDIKDHTKIKTMKSYKGSVPFLIVLKEDGTYEKKRLDIGLEIERFVFSPKINKEISDKEYLVLSRFNDRMKLGKMTFKN